MALVQVEHHQGYGSAYLARVEGFAPNRDGREEAAEYAAERIADRIIEARGDGIGDSYMLDDETMVVVDVLDFGDGTFVGYCVSFTYMYRDGETEIADEFIIVRPADMASETTRDAVEKWLKHRIGFVDRIS